MDRVRGEGRRALPALRLCRTLRRRLGRARRDTARPTRTAAQTRDRRLEQTAQAWLIPPTTVGSQRTRRPGGSERPSRDRHLDHGCRFAVVGRTDETVGGCGLVSVLESDPRVQVSKCDLKLSALERALAECAARLVILDWPLDLGVVTSLRLLRPGVDVVVFAPAPTHAFGVLVLAAGASCVSS